jgi:hypothetical protein
MAAGNAVVVEVAGLVQNLGVVVVAGLDDLMGKEDIVVADLGNVVGKKVGPSIAGISGEELGESLAAPVGVDNSCCYVRCCCFLW